MGFDLFLKNGKAPSGGEERSGTRTDGGAPEKMFETVKRNTNKPKAI